MINKTIICDDHPVVRQGIRAMLEPYSEFQLLPDATSGSDLLKKIRKDSCDIVVLDYSMPGEIDGFGLIRKLAGSFPKLKILVLSGMASPLLSHHCLEAGAHGFVSKTTALGKLVSAARCVLSGKNYRDEEEFSVESVSHDFDENLLKLSPREMTVIRMRLSGLSVNEISTKLNKDYRTISAQKNSALRKMGVDSEVKLFQLAANSGLLPSSITSVSTC